MFRFREIREIKENKYGCTTAIPEGNDVVLPLIILQKETEPEEPNMHADTPEEIGWLNQTRG